MSKILQYELWQECNNRCTYCTLGNNAVKTPDYMKLESINTAISELRQLVKGEVSTLGFIGGEFFQGQLHNREVKQAFFDLIDLSNQLLNDGIINELWLNATLTIGDQRDLYNTLNRIDRKDKVWILTSFDSLGRFHHLNMLDNWYYHMDKLYKEYPEIRRNTTSIITGDFIKLYLNGTIDLTKFSLSNHTEVFLKTPVKPDDKCEMSRVELNKLFGYEFFPKKKDFINFLFKYKEREGDTAFNKLFSNELKAEELHKNFNESELRNVVFHRNKDFVESLDCDKNLKEIEALNCGHSQVYQCYVDSDDCAVCDKAMIATL